MRSTAFTIFVVLVSLAQELQAQDTASYLQTRIVIDSLHIPWDMDYGPDGHIWFSERNGYISRLDPDSGKLKRMYFIDDVYQSHDNSGLHAFALHPSFPIVPYAYAHYTFRDFFSRLIRLTYDVSRDTFTSPVELLGDIPANISHNGSRLIFDDEGYMYFTTGDAFSGWEFPQDPASVAGKILRMKDDGTAAPGNPFDNRVWSKGHRNPQGLVFSDNGTLYSSEHGPATDDELNIIKKGGNYGWPNVSGNCDLPSEQHFCDSANVVEPLTLWTPTQAPCGIAYFNHSSIPEWENSILMGFLKAKQLKVIHLNDAGDSVLKEVAYLDHQFGRIRDVLVLPNGRIFICTSNREPNGEAVVQPDDDKIIEVYNPNFNYETFVRKFHEASEFIFPNPVNAHLHLALEKKDINKVSYTIYSMSGKVVQHSAGEMEYVGNSLFIDVHDLPNGLYLFELIDSTGKAQVQKFQVLHE